MDSNASPPATPPRALVVYESMFGNTEDVARAVAAGLQPRLDVDVVEVGTAPRRVDGVDLLVIGAPTHAFGLSRARTRADAATKGARPDASVGPGIRDWLAALAPPARPVSVAAFDTRIARPRVPGSAARAARRRLRRLGFDASTPAASFWVTSTRGPLADGERDRARHWGAELAAALLEPGVPQGVAG